MSMYLWVKFLQWIAKYEIESAVYKNQLEADKKLKAAWDKTEEYRVKVQAEVEAAEKKAKAKYEDLYKTFDQYKEHVKHIKFKTEEECEKRYADERAKLSAQMAANYITMEAQGRLATYLHNHPRWYGLKIKLGFTQMTSEDAAIGILDWAHECLKAQMENAGNTGSRKQ